MWKNVLYSFPIQLLLLHFKKNLFLIFFWILLTLIVLQNFGTVLGIPFLFLDPEYLNAVSWQGFFLMGIGLAIFTMAFHMTTYILDAVRYRFLAVIKRPFIQFCVNNSIIPLIFYIIYLYSFIAFQLDNELPSNWEIVRYILGFILGTVMTYAVVFVYLSFTNKDFFILFADSVEKQMRKVNISRANMLRQIKESRHHEKQVLNYLDYKSGFKSVVRDFSKYQGYQLFRVFDQNHLNLFIIQALLIFLILFLGFFREYPFLQIPAAMSGLLLLAVLMMLVGAVAFWLRDWAIPLVLGGLVLLNYMTGTEFYNRPHTAFGLNYNIPPADYSLEYLEQLLHADSIQKDKDYTLGILQNWRNKFPEDQNPRMVFITTSGGGQRSALWTLNVLQNAEKVSDGRLFNHTQMITGASGGTVGAAFFREIYLRSLDDPSIDIYARKYLDQISSDNLNPIIFTLLVNDLLIRNQYFEYNGRLYLKDRGYAFENQLNINTEGVLDKPLKSYRVPEYESKIPMLPIAPLITNDGRKLFISPHSMAYMGISIERSEGPDEKSQSIDFQRFFAGHDAPNLRFLSALRMGATFPFITPHIQLPSIPRMETMDAGLSDNFGIQDAIRFMYIFQNWIKENTSGVTLVTIRDSEKSTEIEPKKPPTILQKLSTPLKNIYINWDNVQTLNNEVLFNYMKESLEFDLEKIEFEYSVDQYLKERYSNKPSAEVSQEEIETQRASLNWRLTAREKKSILDNINSAKNIAALREIQNIQFTIPE